MRATRQHRDLGPRVWKGIRRLVVLAEFVAIAFWASTSAWACTCQSLAPAERLQSADAAFAGTVIDVPPEAGTGPPPVGYTWVVFSVDQWVKNGFGERVSIAVPEASNSCHVSLTPGQRVGVYAFIVDGALSADLCSVVDAKELTSIRTTPLPTGAGHARFLVAVEASTTQAIVLNGAGEQVASIENPQSMVDVAVCPGEAFVAEGYVDEVLVRDLATMQPSFIVQFEDIQGPRPMLCRAEDGSDILVAATINGEYAAFRIRDSIERLTDDQWAAIEFTPGYIVAGSPDMQSRIVRIDIETGEQLLIRHNELQQGSNRSWVNSDNGLIVVDSIDRVNQLEVHALTTYDVKTGHERATSGVLDGRVGYGWVGESFGAVDATDPKDLLLVDPLTFAVVDTEIPASNPVASDDGSVYWIEGATLFGYSNESKDIEPIVDLPSDGYRLLAVFDQAPEITSTTTAPQQTAETAGGWSTLVILSGIAVLGLVALAALLRRRSRRLDGL